jgi:flagellar hook-associated protein 1
MSGLSGILEAAKRAMQSQRFGINVTSHNIANASTPGFSRQRVHLEPTIPLRTQAGMLGTGVRATHIGRIRERFIDQQIRLANDSFGEAEIKYRIISQIESIFNEPSEAGLSAALGRFFNSFQDLALHPEESSARNTVLQQGLLLTQSFNRLSTGLQQLRDDLTNDVHVKVNRINELTKEISRLDIEITNTQAKGFEPADLKDQRDLLIDELSKLANIHASEDNNGSVLISLGGTVIASRAGAVNLRVEGDGSTISIINELNGRAMNVTGGELSGVLSMYNREVSDLLERLDQLAGKLIGRVNEIHANGYGIGDPPPTGISFFEGTDAGNIRINEAILNDIMNIAASADGTAGSNGNALALSDIPDELLFNDNRLSINQFYNVMISDIGSRINANESIIRSQTMVLNQLEHQRAAVSGVSIDEEMANLIKYQRAYEASARVVRTVDEMFQSIINMV